MPDEVYTTETCTTGGNLFKENLKTDSLYWNYTKVKKTRATQAGANIGLL